MTNFPRGVAGGFILGGLLMLGAGCGGTTPVTPITNNAVPTKISEAGMTPKALIASRLTAAGLKFTEKDGTAQIPLIFKAPDAELISSATTFVIEKNNTKISVMLFDYTGKTGSITMRDTISAVGQKAKDKDSSIETGFFIMDNSFDIMVFYLYTGSYTDFKAVQDLLEQPLAV